MWALDLVTGFLIQDQLNFLQWIISFQEELQLRFRSEEKSEVHHSSTRHLFMNEVPVFGCSLGLELFGLYLFPMLSKAWILLTPCSRNKAKSCRRPKLFGEHRILLDHPDGAGKND